MTKKEALITLLYPRRCPICHQPAPYGKEICPECERALPEVNAKRCRICSQPIEDFETLCADCTEITHAYTEGLGVFLYDETMRGAMSYLKYKGRREYGPVLGRLAAERARLRIANWHCTAVVPVPIHPSRARSRGYNQASLIAQAVADTAGLPFVPDALVRLKQTKAMKALSPKERRENLRGAFGPGRALPPGARALVVDDIYTTGATIDACAEVLLSSGAEAVYFLTVCIGKGVFARY